MADRLDEFEIAVVALTRAKMAVERCQAEVDRLKADLRKWLQPADRPMTMHDLNPAAYGGNFAKIVAKALEAAFTPAGQPIDDAKMRRSLIAAIESEPQRIWSAGEIRTAMGLHPKHLEQLQAALASAAGAEAIHYVRPGYYMARGEETKASPPSAAPAADFDANMLQLRVVAAIESDRSRRWRLADLGSILVLAGSPANRARLEAAAETAVAAGRIRGVGEQVYKALPEVADGPPDLALGGRRFATTVDGKAAPTPATPAQQELSISDPEMRRMVEFEIVKAAGQILTAYEIRIRLNLSPRFAHPISQALLAAVDLRRILYVPPDGYTAVAGVAVTVAHAYLAKWPEGVGGKPTLVDLVQRIHAGAPLPPIPTIPIEALNGTLGETSETDKDCGECGICEECVDDRIDGLREIDERGTPFAPVPAIVDLTLQATPKTDPDDAWLTCGLCGEHVEYDASVVAAPEHSSEDDEDSRAGGPAHKACRDLIHADGVVHYLRSSLLHSVECPCAGCGEMMAQIRSGVAAGRHEKADRALDTVEAQARAIGCDLVADEAGHIMALPAQPRVVLSVDLAIPGSEQTVEQTWQDGQVIAVTDLPAAVATPIHADPVCGCGHLRSQHSGWVGVCYGPSYHCDQDCNQFEAVAVPAHSDASAPTAIHDLQPAAPSIQDQAREIASRQILSYTRRVLKILELQPADEWASSALVALWRPAEKQTVRNALSELTKKGLIRRVGEGVYQANEGVTTRATTANPALATERNLPRAAPSPSAAKPGPKGKVGTAIYEALLPFGDRGATRREIGDLFPTVAAKTINKALNNGHQRRTFKYLPNGHWVAIPRQGADRAIKDPPTDLEAE